MNDIHAVVFDIGNVLVGWQPEAFFDSRIGASRRQKLFAEVDLNGMNLAVDRGAPFAESVRGLAAQHPDWHDEIMLWHDGWPQMFAPVIAENVALLRGLRAQGMPVFALSNFGRETFALACETHNFLTEFDQRYISGHLGVLKPEPEIYRILERESGVPPQNLFFIDDRPENIVAAIARGWSGHVFEHPDTLQADLQKNGINVAMQI
ncbi:MAG: 2-haloacid dehalogenase superfamily enzyme [Roseibaca calidilacus]|uniref:2-haloacid dehalogenase n=1 Tax=Roseibaca calidilacus TaxID=1666912 RepID=A0A0P7WFH2_9RHOB|nr:HAD family phosphatase [Roseibaca calidilacus]KPP92735.1 MAG: 2-haloacid dehalogenase superfamily enzyme [Roseibaca calidilacus]CUX80192.1 2-haloacid dehalogenase [Roseibaca calidilacus]